MTDENVTELFNDEEELVQEKMEIPANKVAVGFHPLGGIGITITDHEGKAIQARLSPPEVYQLTGNLTSLVGILMMEGYMAQMQAAHEAQQLSEQVSRGGIVLPGGANVRR